MTNWPSGTLGKCQDVGVPPNDDSANFGIRLFVSWVGRP